MINRILATIFLALSCLMSAVSSVPADGDIVILREDGKSDKDAVRHRIPARPIMGHYSEGVFAVPEWPYCDETARLAIATDDGAVAVDLDCSGSDIAAGIYIGCFDSFTVTITAASGQAFTGEF